MRRMSTVAALVALFCLHSAAAAGALGIIAPASALLGDAITVYVPPQSDIRRISVTLSSGDGKVVVTAHAFPYVEGGKISAWVAVLGVPTTISPGNYRVETTIATGSGVDRRDSPISIGARKFAHENIDLDQELTDLQTEDSATKAKQARDLWHILTTFDNKAVYQLGPLIVPVDKYVVTSPFAERRLFVFVHGGDQRSIHEGIDLAVPAGTPIRAAGAGRVVFDGNWLMTGDTIVIEQLPGVYSLYFHMERSAVAQGEIVKQGQIIGYVGASGLATGPHLHWQVEVDGVPVDPMSLLETGLLNVSTLASLSASR